MSCVRALLVGNKDLIWDSFITQNKITKHMPCTRYVESLCFKLNIIVFRAFQSNPSLSSGLVPSLEKFLPK